MLYTKYVYSAKFCFTALVLNILNKAILSNSTFFKSTTYFLLSFLKLLFLCSEICHDIIKFTYLQRFL